MSTPPIQGPFDPEEFWRFYRYAVENFYGGKLSEAEWNWVREKAESVEHTRDMGNLANIVSLALYLRFASVPQDVANHFAKLRAIWIWAFAALVAMICAVAVMAAAVFTFGHSSAQMQTKVWDLAKERMALMNSKLEMSITTFAHNEAPKFGEPVANWARRLDQDRQGAYLEAISEPIKVTPNKGLESLFVADTPMANWVELLVCGIVLLGIAGTIGYAIGFKSKAAG